MFSSADRSEAMSLMGRYIEKLQGKGQMGRQTLRDLSKVLQYKADVLDRRYIKCVLFPEFSKGARIPAPHTVPTGTWKIVTEFSYTVPVDGANAVPVEHNLGFVADLEMGARNQQCMYVYKVDKGAFSSFPIMVINGRGTIVSVDSATGTYATDNQSSLDFAAMDPTSLYTRYRLVGASISFIPVTIKNVLAEFNLAQTDDFDLSIKSSNAAADTAVIGSGPLVEYLCGPLSVIQKLVDLKPDGPFLDFSGMTTVAPNAGGKLPDDAHLDVVFKSPGTAIQLAAGMPPALIGAGVAWSPNFNLVTDVDQSGWVSRLFGIGSHRYVDKDTLTTGHMSEQAKMQLELVLDNSNIIPAIMALNFIMMQPVGNTHNITNAAAYMSLKGQPANVWLKRIQTYVNSSEIFSLCQGIIRSMFPVITVPRERNRRNMSKVKIQECPYQIVSSLGMGTRMIYLPRSSKSLTFRDIEEVLSDQKKDIFWGCTTGLMSGDQFKVILTRHFEGVCSPSISGYLSVERTTPDAKTLETVDRIATLAPDLITVPPHLTEETYRRVRDSLGYLVIGENPVESKTDGQLRQQMNYDRDQGSANINA